MDHDLISFLQTVAADSPSVAAIAFVGWRVIHEMRTTLRTQIEGNASDIKRLNGDVATLAEGVAEFREEVSKKHAQLSGRMSLLDMAVRNYEQRRTES
jgi:hypothetical protein